MKEILFYDIIYNYHVPVSLVEVFVVVDPIKNRVIRMKKDISNRSTNDIND